MINLAQFATAGVAVIAVAACLDYEKSRLMRVCFALLAIILLLLGADSLVNYFHGSTLTSETRQWLHVALYLAIFATSVVRAVGRWREARTNRALRRSGEVRPPRPLLPNGMIGGKR